MRVLDKGFVELIDSMGSDQRVVEAARVSVKSPAVKLVRSDEKLIRYLATNRHTSPFEHVLFTFRVKAPLFVVRQWMRHRTASYNEESARYGEMSNEFYFPEISRYQSQSADNKQASGSELLYPEQIAAAGMLEGACEHAYEVYTNLLNVGVARELARFVLPVNIYSTFYVTVNLHNLMHFIRLREHSHSQWEIQQYAKVLKLLASDVAPVSVAALGTPL